MMSQKKQYSNLDHINILPSKRKLLQWMKERRSKKKDFSFQVPRAESIDLRYLHENRVETTITWVGHSTFLIQIGGKNFLTDPVWAKWMGFEKRLSEPGLPLAEVPEIDFVLISHAHYDHLHFPTLRKLKGNPLYLVPAGLSPLMKRKGHRRVMEYHWWEEYQTDDLTIAFVPAQHWTRRTLWDTNTSHWGGWVIQKKEGETIYFAGDSGYFRGFQEIGQRFAIDYALLPIGAYEPEWFMSPQHISPEEAVKAFLKLKAKTFIPMHYGAFRLADDTPQEALERLTRAWEEENLPKSRLRVLALGEILISEGKESGASRRESKTKESLETR